MQRMPDEHAPLWIKLFCVAWLSGTAAGCGAPAAPPPPPVNLPQPVHDLAVSRAGDAVHATFTAPAKTTDKLPVKGPMAAELCRSVESGPCQPVHRETISSQPVTVSIEDALPPDLTQGAPRLLTYKVNILNRLGKTGGDSNPAWTAAGAAPAPVATLTATPERKGIVLSWQGVSDADGIVQFDRKAISPSATPAMTAAAKRGAKAAIDQALRLPEAPSDRRVSAIDTTAAAGPSGTLYRYVAQRIETMTLGGHTMQIASRSSPAVDADYRDIYPPPVPKGLVSAPDSAEKAIDLNWIPDVDPGLAGYVVYRRPADSSTPPQRVSPPSTPVRTSSWRDTTAQPGERYAYSVSALDTSGNESQRSAEVEDEWSADVVQPASKP